MPPVGFEPTITAGERLQTYALDRAATGTGSNGIVGFLNIGHSEEDRTNDALTEIRMEMK